VLFCLAIIHGWWVLSIQFRTLFTDLPIDFCKYNVKIKETSKEIKMSQTIPDITVTTNTYTSLNSTLGIPVGTPFQIQLKTTGSVRLQEKTTQPINSSEDGVILTDVSGGYAIADITSGSLEIWAKSITSSVRLSVVVK
jgi:hypothetical protein